MPEEALRWKRPVAVYRDGNPNWYRIVDAVRPGEAAQVYLYDEIGYVGVRASDFANDINAINAKSIDLHVSSPGGDVFDGVAIYNTIRNHPATVTAYVDGVAASAASFIIQAADKVVMAPNATMMVHDAFSVCVGNSAEMRTMADLLDMTSDNIASIYAECAGGSAEQWRGVMRNTTWYRAEEAVAAGLADEIQKSSQPSQRAQARMQWDQSVLNYVTSREVTTQPSIPSVDAKTGDDEIVINSAALADTLKEILQ